MFLIEMALLPRILTLFFLVTAMLSVGLQTKAGDLRSLLKSKGLLLRSLLANFVAVPIVGIVLVRTLPFKPEAAAALLLLACTPGGISALQFTTRIKGASLFAGSSAFLLAFLAVFLSPALLALVLPGDISVVIPYGRASLRPVFASLDLRVAKVLDVKDHPNADSLYLLNIDLGNLGKRVIVEGMKKHYKIEEMKGKNIVVVVNLKPATIRGVKSNGMLLAATDKKGVCSY